jgi:hypothetical protein
MGLFLDIPRGATTVSQSIPWAQGNGRTGSGQVTSIGGKSNYFLPLLYIAEQHDFKRVPSKKKKKECGYDSF